MGLLPGLPAGNSHDFIHEAMPGPVSATEKMCGRRTTGPFVVALHSRRIAEDFFFESVTKITSCCINRDE